MHIGKVTYLPLGTLLLYCTYLRYGTRKGETTPSHFIIVKLAATERKTTSQYPFRDGDCQSHVCESLNT